MVATAVVCCHRKTRNRRQYAIATKRIKKKKRKNRKKISPFTKLDSHQFWSRWRRHCVVFPLFIIRQLAIFFSTAFFSFFPSARSAFFLCASVCRWRSTRICCDFIFPSIARNMHVARASTYCSSFNASRSLTSLSSSFSIRCCCCCCWRSYEIMSMCRFPLPRVPLMFYFLWVRAVCGREAQSQPPPPLPRTSLSLPSTEVS